MVKPTENRTEIRTEIVQSRVKSMHQRTEMENGKSNNNVLNIIQEDKCTPRNLSFLSALDMMQYYWLSSSRNSELWEFLWTYNFSSLFLANTTSPKLNAYVFIIRNSFF